MKELKDFKEDYVLLTLAGALKIYPSRFKNMLGYLPESVDKLLPEQVEVMKKLDLTNIPRNVYNLGDDFIKGVDYIPCTDDDVIGLYRQEVARNAVQHKADMISEIVKDIEKIATDNNVSAYVGAFGYGNGLTYRRGEWYTSTSEC